MDNILQILQREFDVAQQHLAATIALIDEGNTIPFIARYRKEVTGSLDDQKLRELADRLAYLRGLAEKREQYRAAIADAGAMTEEIAAALDAAQTLVALEDIYRPYRPKRRTKASIARDKGLAPLAQLIFAQTIDGPIEHFAADFVNDDVPTVAEAIAGAGDIIAEMISDDAVYRAMVRDVFNEKGMLACKGTDAAKESVYEMYYDFAEPVKKAAGHRVLAMNRGEKEGFLRVSIDVPEDEILAGLNGRINKKNPHTEALLKSTVEDAYKRLIAPSIEREVRGGLTEKSEEGAIKVFAENLRQLLLAAPIKDKVVMAIDPGYRTGCKTCVVSPTGAVLAIGTVFPTPPANKIAEAKSALLPLIQRFGVDIIAIGNGTASRETELFVADMLKEAKSARKVQYVIVNEAGASVYSASKLAAQEFPDYNVEMRSAVSIGRRLQDPMAELVKIDPKSIGVGQYQHDMSQKRLNEALGGVVEDCVNSVGVELNTASPSLLNYVAGISASVAKNILAHREKSGKFNNRKELLAVKGLGPKAFEQCAGFLRIPGGQDPLDATGVHPESYDAARKILESALAGTKPNIARLAKELNIGAPTLADILKELEKPGRDPRDDAPPPILRSDVLSMEDLHQGMVLKGTVRNIMDFGAFIDIGVHQDGLVHISQMSDKYIKHPLEAVKVGDIVDVMILSVDPAKKRISLTMKFRANSAR